MKVWTKRSKECVPLPESSEQKISGKHSNSPHWENKALYRDLTNLLANSGLAGYGHAIDLMAKKAVFPESDDLAYYTAFQRVVFAMVNFAQHAGDVAEMTFDKRLESEHNARFIYGAIRDNESDWAPYLSSRLSFEVVMNKPRIQVSDLLARD